MGIEKLIRPDLADFGGYAARKSPDTLDGQLEVAPENVIKLDANENPYGCSPRVTQALAAVSDFNIYPDNSQTRLRELLAGYTGVAARNIVAGSGSNQLIDLVIRLFVGNGDEVINCVPTFGIYGFSTKLCGGKLVEVRRNQDFAVDIKTIRSSVTPRTKLICLANPNNPSGTLTPPPDIEALLASGLPMLIDEAYYEFSGQTSLPLISRYENLMVLRTFSKWAGLAGLRVGCGIFPPKVADYILKTKIPYNVNVAALVAVRESLKDVDYLMGTVRAITAERGRLFAELSQFDWLRPFPSQANFILCSVLKLKAKELQQKLQDKGILVRYFDQPLLRNFIRISVGKPEHTDALIKALKEINSRVREDR